VRLYPEDIEKVFEMVPNGTQVRVVNQPYLFGWHDDRLYLQAYTVLEDDARNWQNAQKKLQARALTPQLQAALKSAGASIDWQGIAAVTHEPRGNTGDCIGRWRQPRWRARLSAPRSESHT